QTGILVTAASASTFIVSGYLATTAGGAQNFLMVAEEEIGSAARRESGTVLLSSSTDSQATFAPASYTFTTGDNGTHLLGGTLKTVGTQSITATDTVSSTIKGSQTGIVVTAASASTFIVSGYLATTTAGVPHTFTVTAK